MTDATSRNGDIPSAYVRDKRTPPPSSARAATARAIHCRSRGRKDPPSSTTSPPRKTRISGSSSSGRICIEASIGYRPTRPTRAASGVRRSWEIGRAHV